MTDEEIKNEVFKLVHIFGLNIDLDRWDEKGWIRVNSKDWPEDFGYRDNCLILYKDDVKTQGIQLIREELIQNLINLGQNLKAKEIRKTLNLS